MTYTARELIADAYYLTGIVAEGFSVVSGQQSASGLKRLNALLAVKSFDDKHIPYFQEYDFNTVPNVGTYEIPNLIRIETHTYNINTLRLPTVEVDRDRYFQAPRVDNVYTLPFTWHFERNKNGGVIYYWPIPNAVYQIRLWCKMALSNVTLDTDLESTYDDFYIEYLLYGLASFLCQKNGITFSPENQKQLDIYTKQIINVSPLDVRLQLVNPFSNATIPNWGFVNLFNGFVPTGSSY